MKPKLIYLILTIIFLIVIFIILLSQVEEPQEKKSFTVGEDVGVMQEIEVDTEAPSQNIPTKTKSSERHDDNIYERADELQEARDDSLLGR